MQGQRDVLIVDIDDTMCLVQACDSCGAIGSKPYDKVKVPWTWVGRLTVRVALLEVLSVGAEPVSIMAGIANEPRPAAEGVLEGIWDELRAGNLEGIQLGCSTEKNIPTLQTGIGITVTGVVEKHRLRLGCSQAGDTVYCIGIPKVGEEITDLNDSQLMNVQGMRLLLDRSDTHEILPVGSKGILYEAENLAALSGLRFLPDNSPYSMAKSAGPSTCAVFSSASDSILQLACSLPIVRIGRLSKERFDLSERSRF